VPSDFGAPELGCRARVPPRPLIRPGLLITRRFGIPNAINLVFRAVLVVTSYLVPQFLRIVHGYRSLELAWLLVWAVVPQAIALPLVWWLLKRLDARWIMVAGLAVCATSTAIRTQSSRP
jgi:DHA2 family multidrug resistance protein